MVAQKNYTAIYVGNDYMTAGVVTRFEKLGIRIPEDISIICFDDSPLISEDSLNITCISCDPKLMGRSAADLLLKRIADPLGQHQKITFLRRSYIELVFKTFIKNTPNNHPVVA